MDLTGKIKVIDAEQQVSASFVKRDMVISTDEQYPQHIQIQFTQDKVDLLDAYKVGQEVIVSINIRGREWVNPQGESKYFNTIQGWRIQKVRKEGEVAETTAAQQSAPFIPNTEFKEEDHDDLPF